MKQAPQPQRPVRPPRAAAHVYVAGMGVIYFWAIGSYYIQFPGLYSSNSGLMPVNKFISNNRLDAPAPSAAAALQEYASGGYPSLITLLVKL